MKNYFYKNINKVTAIAMLLLVTSVLTSCRGGSWQTTVFTTWKAEFHFGSFFSAMFGWPIAILSYPVAYLMSTIGSLLGDSYAWGIVFTTFIVRTVAWPIYAKQNDSTIKMQLIQPEMERTQMKYKGRTDPESQRRMQQEIMQLYKKYNMNPLGCFFTTIMQFPIFMSMYEVVKRINLAQTETIGGVLVSTPGKFALANTKLGIFELNNSFATAATLHDKIFIVVLAFSFGGITFLSQKLASKTPSYVKKRPNANGDQMQKQMKMMTYIMTGMFVMMCFSSTSLALYWFIGGIYQLFQSHIGRKRNEKNYYKLKEKMI